MIPCWTVRASPGATRAPCGQTEIAPPLVEREFRAELLNRRTTEKLAGLAEKTPGAATSSDALALAEPARLTLADTGGNTVGMNETMVVTPHPKGACALERCTPHAMDPRRGQPRARRPPGTRGYDF